MTKISIRFYNDREVRAVWDEEKSKWWFSVLDIVGVLNDQDDYQKNRNYWKYLKTKLRKEQSQLVSATNQLKLLAADGKRYATDTLDYKSISKLYELEDRFDGEYKAIMDLFRESNLVQKTAINYYFWLRDEKNVWQRIEPSFCRM